jgi:hypothetical protein
MTSPIPQNQDTTAVPPGIPGAIAGAAPVAANFAAFIG